MGIMKQNDTRPIYQTILKQTIDDVESVVDLTNIDTIKFKMRKEGEDDPKVDADMEVVGDPGDGTIKYVWQPGDTDTVDDYQVEIEVTWLDGGVETWPSDSYESITILDDLDNP